ncbi:MAG: HDOD domain-containing protein [Gallionella sp.]
MNSSENTVSDKLEKSLLDIRIPPRPAILDRIKEEAGREEPNFIILSKLIAEDVGLSAGLIKTANSPYFGFSRKLTTVQEALLALGLDVASKAVAGVSLRNALPKSPALERFWFSSAHVARLSGWLVRELDFKSIRPDDAYTYALFRDCGIPILLSHFVGYYDVLSEANFETLVNFTAVEDRHLPTNHAAVGALLAQSWYLSDDTSNAIRHHHDSDDIIQPSKTLTNSSLQLVALAQLSEYLLQKNTGLCHTEEWLKLGNTCMQILDITDAEIELMSADADKIIKTSL